ncbi:MAG TPA: galactokinase [Candidatus Acidoferrales bacterium]|nr:galactokinase [Candidatus Acidoferrales bacterium]
MRQKFASAFGVAAAMVCRAPGRVNLIGEHTDYNDGFVMPAAIGFSCWIAGAGRDDRKLRIISENFAEVVKANLDAELRPGGTWADYVLGVAWALGQAGLRLRGADLYIHGEVPLGAGLSSSAAVEVATAFSLLSLSASVLDRTEIARLCRRAECEFVGARVGIMDQFVSCHGRAGNALMLDCRSLEYQLLPVPGDAELVICNTMVKHALASGEYNARRSECEEGVRELSKVLPGIRSLRDVVAAQLEEHRALLRPAVYRRSRHVISENDRVVRAAAALRTADCKAFGRLMLDSHRSLRDDYQVSCRELDLMVELACKQPGVYGSRMTGGGFGGCTVSLVRSENAAKMREHVSAEYERATGLRPDVYVCAPADGAEMVWNGASEASAGGEAR